MGGEMFMFVRIRNNYLGGWWRIGLVIRRGYISEMIGIIDIEEILLCGVVE